MNYCSFAKLNYITHQLIFYYNNMNKVILSFALLFAVFFINSCKEDDTVSPDSSKPKLVKFIEQHTNFEGTIERVINISYNDNKISKVFMSEPGLDITTEYQYNTDNILSIKVDILNEGKRTKTDLSFEYQMGNLTKVTALENGQIVYIADYFYSGNNLSEIIAKRLDGFIVVDSSYCSNFIDGRPGLFKRFYRNNLEPLKIYFNQKLVYQNGNMTERYNWNEEKSRWDIEMKRTFDRSKEAAFSSIKDFFLTIDNRYPFIPNNYDKNLFTKTEMFNLSCDGIINNEPVLYESTTYTTKYNTLGLLEEITSQDEAFCGSRNLFTSVYKLTWE